VSIRLRDRFFALSAGQAPAEEVARYLAEVDATDTEPAATLDGLGVSWHPTARFKAVRFVDAERIDEGVRERFARPSELAPHLAAVFVDPRELSFRTFENIVPLDRWFADVPLRLELGEPEELAKDVYASSLRLPDAGRARLEGLDTLGLYVPPLNAATRGGERFIFHSALLAEALTEAVRNAMPEPMLDGFSHVNPVFRGNRFEPGDSHFHRHLDTPYYDAARGHVSRYTVLLYLTGGTGEPALVLTGGTALADIESFTCVVFDQRYEHEGAPFRDGRKVFLRTELIFAEDPEVTHDPEIGALFSKACYLTGESVFAPELARPADACYNQVAAAHWNGLARGPAREPYLHKRFRGVHFVANGYDFWFARNDALSLAECAAITLLDYFNCRLGDESFRDLCESAVVEAEDDAWIPAFLKDKGGAGTPAVAPFDKSHLFPESELTDDVCCPFHDMGAFDPTRLDEIVDLNERAQSFAKAHIMPAPILMLGEDVVLDPEKFMIRGNQIHVLGKESLTPVNFAACWNAGGDPGNYIDVAATVGAEHFLVPPILFSETDDCYHLRFDFFRNTWMVKHRRATVPVPKISSLAELDLYELEEGAPQPWLEAVDPALVKGGSGEQPVPWWAEDSPLVDELYDYLTDYEYEGYDRDEDEDEEEDEK
ncbi:2OG-Fe(II) oxygenase, partial [Nonomuraea sp. RK-328]|nr:2OG-Fe(II) oxygenase [Nonomuraea sp. RK-328]